MEEAATTEKNCIKCVESAFFLLLSHIETLQQKATMYQLIKLTQNYRTQWLRGVIVIFTKSWVISPKTHTNRAATEVIPRRTIGKELKLIETAQVGGDEVFALVWGTLWLNKKECEDNRPGEEVVAAQPEEILVAIQVLFIKRKVLTCP